MITLGPRPNESSTMVITVYFKDVDGTAFTPIDCVWSLTDESGNVINGRDRVAKVITGTYENFVLSGNDIRFSDGPSRVFLVEGTYNSAYANGVPYREEAKFYINNTVRDAL